jgi:hypothetical protein
LRAPDLDCGPETGPEWPGSDRDERRKEAIINNEESEVAAHSETSPTASDIGRARRVAELLEISTIDRGEMQKFDA